MHRPSILNRAVRVTGFDSQSRTLTIKGTGISEDNARDILKFAGSRSYKI